MATEGSQESTRALLPSIGSTQALHCGGQFAEEPAEGEVECLAGRGEPQASPILFKQPDPDVIGEFGDTATDGAVRERKRVCCKPDRAQPRCCFERSQVVERGYVRAIHR